MPKNFFEIGIVLLIVTKIVKCEHNVRPNVVLIIADDLVSIRALFKYFLRN